MRHLITVNNEISKAIKSTAADAPTVSSTLLGNKQQMPGIRKIHFILCGRMCKSATQVLPASVCGQCVCVCSTSVCAVVISGKAAVAVCSFCLRSRLWPVPLPSRYASKRWATNFSNVNTKLSDPHSQSSIPTDTLVGSECVCLESMYFRIWAPNEMNIFHGLIAFVNTELSFINSQVFQAAAATGCWYWWRLQKINQQAVHLLATVSPHEYTQYCTDLQWTLSVYREDLVLGTSLAGWQLLMNLSKPNLLLWQVHWTIREACTKLQN